MASWMTVATTAAHAVEGTGESFVNDRFQG